MAILLAARWCELPLATRSSAMPQSLSKTAKIETSRWCRTFNENTTIEGNLPGILWLLMRRD